MGMALPSLVSLVAAPLGARLPTCMLVLSLLFGCKLQAWGRSGWRNCASAAAGAAGCVLVAATLWAVGEVGSLRYSERWLRKVGTMTPFGRVPLYECSCVASTFGWQGGSLGRLLLCGCGLSCHLARFWVLSASLLV